MVSSPPDVDTPTAARYLARQPHVDRMEYLDLCATEHVIGIRVFDHRDVLVPLRDVVSTRSGCKSILWPPQHTSGGGWILDIVGPTCSRARALASLPGEQDVAMHETMAIGDQLNDLELLSAAGLGVAMGNAPDILLRLEESGGKQRAFQCILAAPWRTAKTRACSRDCTPSLPRRFTICARAVFVSICSRSAISLSLRPSARA